LAFSGPADCDRRAGYYDRLMDRQTRELPLLCILAAASGMLAWALDRTPFVALFTAQAAFMAIYLSNPDRLK